MISLLPSGQGSVYFYDVRAEKYLELFCGASVQLEAGMGWLHHDDTYHDFFVGNEYPNAIYTHCYDPAGTRLFTAGDLSFENVIMRGGGERRCQFRLDSIFLPF